MSDSGMPHLVRLLGAFLAVTVGIGLIGAGGMGRAHLARIAGVLSGGTRVNAGDAQSWGAELSATAGRPCGLRPVLPVRISG